MTLACPHRFSSASASALTAMLIAFFRTAVEEIAFEGPPGITWPRLLDRLTARNAPVDVDTRRALWAQCTDEEQAVVVLRDPDGQILSRDGQPLPEPTVPEKKSATPEEVAKERVPRKRLRRLEKPADDDAAVQDAPAAEEQQEEKQPQPWPLLDVADEVRLHLLHLTGHPELAEAANVRRAVQVITKARYDGCWGPFVSLELGVNSRDLFYQMELLRILGLVVCVRGWMPQQMNEEYRLRGGAETAPGAQSNLFFHTRFFDPEKIIASQVSKLVTQVDVPLGKHVLDVVMASPSQVAFECDLRALARTALEKNFGQEINGRVCKRLFARVRQQLVDKRLVECVILWDESGKCYRDALCAYGAHGQAEKHLALQDSGQKPVEAAPTAQLEDVAAGSQRRPENSRMIVPVSAGAVEEPPPRFAGSKGGSSSTAELAAPFDPEDEREALLELGRGWRPLLVRERSLVTQVLDLIEIGGLDDSGKPGSPGYAGITGREIALLLGTRRKWLDRVLDDLVKSKKVVKVLESNGKLHINKYLLAAHATLVCASSASQGALMVARPSAGEGPAASASGSPAQGKTRGSGVPRVNVMFEKRLEKAWCMIQERGVVSIHELQRACEADCQLSSRTCKMDRKSASRILQALSDGNEFVTLSLCQTACMPRFAYWTPTLTEEEAHQQIAAELTKKRVIHGRRGRIASHQRSRKTRPRERAAIDEDDGGSKLLALGDDGTVAEPAAEEVVAIAEDQNSVFGDRRILEYVNASRLDGKGIVRLGPKRDAHQDQRVKVFYGFQAPIMVRVHLLHGYLMRSVGLDESIGWSTSEMVNEMPLDIFLQVIGCGHQSEYLDKVLLSRDHTPRLREVPGESLNLMLNRNYAGQSRVVISLQRMMAHLIKLRLADKIAHPPRILARDKKPQQQQSPRGGQERGSPAMPRAQVWYRLVRHVELPEMMAKAEEEPTVFHRFDLATPGAVDRYWKKLQEMSEEWIHSKHSTLPLLPGKGPASARGDESSASSEQSQEAASEYPETCKDVTKKSVVLAPANYKLQELFRKKNWKRKAWLTPQQRSAIEEFCQEQLAVQPQSQRASEPAAEEGALMPAVIPKVLTPRSPEILSLSRRISVATDVLVKCCEHLVNMATKGSDGVAAPVQFSKLCEVRYQCHLCGRHFYQQQAMAEHYQKAHEMDVPDDETVYCEAGFLAQRQVQAKEQALEVTVHGRRRRRRRGWSRRDLHSSTDAPSEGSGQEEAAEPVVQARQVKVRRGAEDNMDDNTWLRLLVVAEQLSLQKVVSDPLVPRAGDVVPGSTWQTLARITGFSSRFCRRRLQPLLADRLRQRSLATLRCQAKERARELLEGGDHEQDVTRGVPGRSLAKVMVFTPHQEGFPWWRMDFFTHRVREMVDCALRQWQGESLVCKYKQVSHAVRMPGGMRPRFVLTWQARLRMFGKRDDLQRICEAVALLQGPLLSTHEGLEVTTAQASGSLMQALAELMAVDAMDLTPVWEDGDIYKRPDPERFAAVSTSSRKPVAQGAGECEDADDVRLDQDAEQSEEAASVDDEGLQLLEGRRYGGVHAHLKSTANEPGIRAIMAERSTDSEMSKHCSDEFLQWLLVSREEFERLSSVPGDLLDPLAIVPAGTSPRQTCNDAVEPLAGISKDKIDSTPAWASFKACACAARVLPHGSERGRVNRKIVGGRETWKEDALLEACVFLLVQLLTIAGTEKASENPRSVVRDEMLTSHWRLPGAGVGTLRDLFEKHFGKAKGGSQIKLFDAALAFLEYLRLLVPFPCGSEFHETPASAAAPYCIKVKSLVSEGASERTLATRMQAELFCQSHAGRHWGNIVESGRVSPNQRLGAAGYVLEAAGLDMPLQSMLLPVDLAAPAAWIDAHGAINNVVLRFVSMRMLHELQRSPGSTAEHLAQTMGLMDECEVAVLFRALVAAGLVDAKQDPGQAAKLPCGGTIRSGPLRYYVQLLPAAASRQLVPPMSDWPIAQALSVSGSGQARPKRSRAASPETNREPLHRRRSRGRLEEDVAEVSMQAAPEPAAKAADRQGGRLRRCKGVEDDCLPISGNSVASGDLPSVGQPAGNDQDSPCVAEAWQEENNAIAETPAMSQEEESIELVEIPACSQEDAKSQGVCTEATAGGSPASVVYLSSSTDETGDSAESRSATSSASSSLVLAGARIVPRGFGGLEGGSRLDPFVWPPCAAPRVFKRLRKL